MEPAFSVSTRLHMSLVTASYNESFVPTYVLCTRGLPTAVGCLPVHVMVLSLRQTLDSVVYGGGNWM